MSDPAVEAMGEGGDLENTAAEENENDAAGSRAVGGGRGVVAVLDDGHEMDRCSCDLVKVLPSILSLLLLAPA